MEENDNANDERPMIGSIIRFVSDWMGGESRQPPPFRATRDSNPDTVIEMQNLLQKTNNGNPDDQKNKVMERQIALEEWNSIQNIDVFLEQMYAYYAGRGVYGILTNRFCNWILIGFLVGFTIFLQYMIDWSFINKPATAISHPTLYSVINVSRIWKMGWIMSLSFLTFLAIYFLQLVRIIQDIPSLYRMQRFYKRLLDINDDQLSTEEFGSIIDKVVKLQMESPISETKMDARDICNRIMRRENYLIALFNKDIFKFEESNGSSFKIRLTKVLEWNLSFCILNFVFDDHCSIRKGFIKDVRRERLSQSLRRRFIIIGLLNLILAPFIFIYMAIYLVFRHGEELYRNPKTIGMRQYTTLARWKLREFNELPHYFNSRLDNSYRKATKYMDQFQSGKFTALAKLASFIAGSFAVVLIGITVANEDLLMHFELTEGKSVIWYLGLFGAILAISRSLMPDPSKSYDPTRLMNSVVEYTHYLPKHWRGKLYTDQVRDEFSTLFDFKFNILLNELLSVIVTPFVLLFKLPSSTDDIVEFFREFTVHVDGIGYICSFALFDFKRHGNPKYTAKVHGITNNDKSNRTKQGKMEKSFLSFISNNPNWKPDNFGEQFLENLQEFDLGQSRIKENPMTKSTVGKLMKKGKSSPLMMRDSLNNNNDDDILHEEPELIYEEEQNSIKDSKANGYGIMSILDQFYDHNNLHKQNI